MAQEHEELSGIEELLAEEELRQAAAEESDIDELSDIDEELLAAEEESDIDESAIEEFHNATEEFVDVLSDVCSKYEIESEDIEAMNDGLEKVWDSVTMSEDDEELPEEIEDAEVPEVELEEEEEDAQAE